MSATLFLIYNLQAADQFESQGSTISEFGTTIWDRELQYHTPGRSRLEDEKPLLEFQSNTRKKAATHPPDLEEWTLPLREGVLAAAMLLIPRFTFN